MYTTRTKFHRDSILVTRYSTNDESLESSWILWVNLSVFAYFGVQFWIGGGFEKED